MSNTKTEAQRLGDQLTKWANDYATTDDTDSMARQAAAELRRLDAENQQLKTSLALVQQHHATAWNRGHQAGIRADESAVKQAIDAVRADAWGNTQLTNALMQAEAERDQLRAQLAKAVAEAREACTKVAQDYSCQVGDAPWECAAAIRARSKPHE